MAATVFPAFMQVPATYTTGTRHSSASAGGTARSRMCAGRPTRSPSSGKARIGAQHLGLERRADVGIGRGAAAQDAAQVEHVDRVADRDVLGDLAGVAAERAAGAERAGEHVAARGATACGRSMSSTVL